MFCSRCLVLWLAKKGPIEDTNCILLDTFWRFLGPKKWSKFNNLRANFVEFLVLKVTLLVPIKSSAVDIKFR